MRGLDAFNLRPVFLLLSRTLRHLSIGFDSPGMSVSSPSSTSVLAVVQNAIAAISPDLSTLHLDHPLRLSSSGARALARLGKLTKLNFCQCERCAVGSDVNSVWRASPMSASLQILVVAVKAVPQKFATVGLRSLQALSIGGTAGDIDSFIRGIQPAQLHTVDLKVWRDASRDPDEAIPSLALSSICRRLPPTVMSLEVNLVEYAPLAPFPLTDVVAALRPLEDLAALMLQVGSTPIVGVEDGLHMLGELCPQLRSLTINQYPGLYAPAALTPRALAEVARCFPKLESLAMPRLDAAELLAPLEADAPPTTISHAHGLRSIEFRDVCGVPEPSLVARAIARLFPQLRLGPSKDVEGVVRGDWHGEWSHVRALLCEMSDM
ncbi:hypothetical protein C8T65DRAFT_76959 [Cerioporus squamosus]|nr:hypothetical protein C8T65DRAFT_76959 [Cerioporus squamosus]